MLKRSEPNDSTRSFELLPAIDLRGGQVVRLSEGDFGRETIYSIDPTELARGFAAAGADWLHIVDLDGARDGARRQTDVITQIVAAAGNLKCEVAGGLRDVPSVDAALAAGASRVVIGTAALRDPSFVETLVTRYGAERVAVALDVRDGLAVGQGWVPGATGVPATEALTTLAERGATTFIVTAIERDGLLNGPNLDLLGTMVQLRRGNIIASAGVSSLGDLLAVRTLGCSGAIVGRAIYEGRLDFDEAVGLVAGF
jgi:phosphoribosylformimino-5-aminoimidazole carboxamide ribotide isomerase